MIRTEKKRAPADYPLLSLRLPKGSDLNALIADLDRVCDLLNEKLPEGHRAITRGAVLVEAVKIGLTEIKRSPKRILKRS